MPQYEDSLSGSADITGDPAPSRPLSAQEIDAITQRKVHGKQQGAQAPQPKGKQQDQQKKDEKDQQQQDPKGLPPQSPWDGHPLGSFMDQLRTSGNPLTGEDWFSGLDDDQETLYYALQEMGQLLSATFKVGGPDFSAPNNLARLTAKNRVQGGGGGV